MDPVSLADLPAILGGSAESLPPAARVSTVSIDSRSVGFEALFFALPGTRSDGHRHLAEAFANGAVAAVVAPGRVEPFAAASLGPLITVSDPLESLQALAGWWRGRLSGRVVGVTGSNGKTMTKDALVHILSGRWRAAGTVGSYNSRLGVPLALLRIPDGIDMAVMEAGVSAPGEMPTLARMLRPDCGILTNVGLAHIGSFGSRAAIAKEKLALFAGIGPGGWVLLPAGDPVLDEAARGLDCPVHRFGAPGDVLPSVLRSRRLSEGCVIDVHYPSGERFEVKTGVPSLEILANLEAALGAAALLGVAPAAAVAAIEDYRPPHTRMEIWRSPVRGITLINDSCSSDPVSVKAALASLAGLGESRGRRVFVFGGMRELGGLHEREHAAIGRLAAEHAVDPLVLVGGEELSATGEAFRRSAPAARLERCERPEQVQSLLQEVLRDGDTVLFKGPRLTGIDRAARSLLDAMAPNRMVIDLQAIGENLLVLRRRMGPGCRLLGMIKALAYGSDLVRVGVELQRLGFDSLGVSTVDEGSALRRAGVHLPILVTLCTAGEADKLVKYDLTPVVYSLDLVSPLATAAAAAGKRVEVHLEVDTGLGRLGVFPAELGKLAVRVRESEWLSVVGVMTHFASAEDPAEDAFTGEQIERFDAAVESLRALGFPSLIRHAAATAGAVRFPRARYDMVRVGIGLYGVYPSPEVEAGLSLQLAVSLITRVSEVRDFPPGARIGYGGTFVAGPAGVRAAVLPIGYHDGVPRRLSPGGSVTIHGCRAPVIGRISMDSMVVDVSGIPDVCEGSDALLYGTRDGITVRPETVAAASGTIVHELLSRIGPRVERVLLG